MTAKKSRARSSSSLKPGPEARSHLFHPLQPKLENPRMKYTKLLTAAALTAALAGTTLPAQAADLNPNGTANHFDLQARRGGLGSQDAHPRRGF